MHQGCWEQNPAPQELNLRECVGQIVQHHAELSQQADTHLSESCAMPRQTIVVQVGQVSTPELLSLTLILHHDPDLALSLAVRESARSGVFRGHGSWHGRSC